MAISQKFQRFEKILQGVKELKKNRLPTDVETAFFKKEKKITSNKYIFQATA